MSLKLLIILANYSIVVNNLSLSFDDDINRLLIYLILKWITLEKFPEIENPAN